MDLWKVEGLISMANPTQLRNPGNFYGFSSILAGNSDQMLDLILFTIGFWCILGLLRSSRRYSSRNNAGNIRGSWLTVNVTKHTVRKTHVWAYSIGQRQWNDIIVMSLLTLLMTLWHYYLVLSSGPLTVTWIILRKNRQATLWPLWYVCTFFVILVTQIHQNLDSSWAGMKW